MTDYSDLINSLSSLIRYRPFTDSFGSRPSDPIDDEIKDQATRILKQILDLMESEGVALLPPDEPA